MKIKIATAITAIALISGCGTPSKEERAKAFDGKIHTLTEAGFNISQPTKDKKIVSYRVAIKDKEKAANYILSAFNMQTLPKKFKDLFAKSFDEVGVDVDLDKLANNSEDSVYVYLLDNNKTKSKALKKLLQHKDIGAFVTYNKDNQVKKIKAKNLDFIADDGSHITLSDLIVDFQKPANNKDDSKEFTLSLKSLKADAPKTANSKIDGVAYLNNLNCHVTKESLIIGEYNCKVGEFNFDTKSKLGRGDALFNMKNITLVGASKSKGSTVVSDAKFAVDAMQLKTTGYKAADITLKNYKLEFSGFAMDKKLVETMQTIIKKGIEKPEVFKEYANVIAKIYENASIKGASSFDELKIDTKRGAKQEVNYEIKDYKGDFDAKFTKVIDYLSHTKYSLLTLKSNNPRKPLDLTLNGYSDTFELKKVYNFMPIITKNLKPGQDYSSPAYKKQEQEMFAKIGQDMLHNGGSISLSPVIINSLSVNAGSQRLNFKKLDLGVSATLKENKISLNNPALIRASLLKNSDINAHIVLSKEDFQTVSKLLPPTMVMLVGAFVKYEKDQAIFKLKSKDGHLYLNDKPVM